MRKGILLNVIKAILQYPDGIIGSAHVLGHVYQRYMLYTLHSKYTPEREPGSSSIAIVLILLFTYLQG